MKRKLGPEARQDGTVVILPKGPITALKGSLPRRAKPLSVEEMNAAVRIEVIKRNRQ